MSSFILLLRSFLLNIINLDIFIYFLIGLVVLCLVNLVLKLALG